MLNHITTWLELVGLVLLAVAAGVQVSSWSVAGGIATGGTVLIGESALVGWRGRREPVGDQTA